LNIFIELLAHLGVAQRSAHIVLAAGDLSRLAEAHSDAEWLELVERVADGGI
jgi:peptidyl-tRNA hydrolase